MLGRVINHAWRLVRNAPLLLKYHDATMVGSAASLENLIVAASALQKPELEMGAVVECGTWRGGMAAAPMEIGGPHRRY